MNIVLKASSDVSGVYSGNDHLQSWMSYNFISVPSIMYKTWPLGELLNDESGCVTTYIQIPFDVPVIINFTPDSELHFLQYVQLKNV